MTQTITLARPATTPGQPAPPPWLVERALQPGEKIAWWQGPQEGPWAEWLTRRSVLLGGLGFAGFFVFPFVGAGLALLLELQPGGGFFFGGLLGVTSMVVGCNLAARADKLTWYIITDRRLLVISGQAIKHAFDLDILRRFMASLPNPAEGPGDTSNIDLRKVGSAITTAPGQAPNGITNLESILEMARLIEQMQGIHKGSK